MGEHRVKRAKDRIWGMSVVKHWKGCREACDRQNHNQREGVALWLLKE